jgi:hypothetical protein
MLRGRHDAAAKMMREFWHDGVEWHVREVSAASVPGSNSEHCLIFDSEMTVRRVWDYPAAWSELSDDDLWHLTTIGRASSTRDTVESMPPRGSHPAVIAAAESAARSSALLAEIAIMRQVTRALRDEREALLESCRQSRDDMRLAVQTYAELLRRDGVPPERALLLIKSAIKAGVEATTCGDVEADRLVGDGVTWGIHAYFAA